ILRNASEIDLLVDIAHADVFVRRVVGDELDAELTVVGLGVERRGGEASAWQKRVAGLGAVLASDAGFGDSSVIRGVILASQSDGVLKSDPQWGSGIGSSTRGLRRVNGRK